MRIGQSKCFALNQFLPWPPSPLLQAYSSGSLEKNSEFLSNFDVSLKHYHSPHLLKATQAARLRPYLGLCLPGGECSSGEASFGKSEESPTFREATTQAVILLNLASAKQVGKGAHVSASCVMGQGSRCSIGAKCHEGNCSPLKLRHCVFPKWLGLSPTGSNDHSPKLGFILSPDLRNATVLSGESPAPRHPGLYGILLEHSPSLGQT